MDTSTYEVRLAHWAQIVKAASERPSSQLLRDWLKENDISKDQYYYWQRKVRDAAYKAMKPEFSDLPKLLTSAVSNVELAEIPLQNSEASLPGFECQNDYSFHPDAVISIKGFSIALSNNTSKSLLSAMLEVVAHA